MTTGTDSTQKTPKRFTLDGEPCSVRDLATDNDLDPVTLNAIGMMEPGDTLVMGGGAGAEFILRREE